MSSVGDIANREEKPPYVTFERIAVENKQKSLEEGRYVGTDVDFVNVTAPYSRDIFKAKAKQWFADIRQQSESGRFPRQWIEKFEKQYQAWQQGQELPLEGTPIRGWGVISPAQQEALIRMHVLTVESLAGMNDEGVKRVGMGGMEMKNKAKGWLAQMNDKGALAMEIAATKAQNSELLLKVDTLTRQVEALMAQKAVVSCETEEIDASDILDDDLEAQYIAKFGEKPHHRMKEETIRAKLKE